MAPLLRHGVKPIKETEGRQPAGVFPISLPVSDVPQTPTSPGWQQGASRPSAVRWALSETLWTALSNL
jgi:hypothetical protein